jgi:hypothetical protein
MPDVGERDLQDANDHYNARLVAAGVPKEGTKTVIGALLNGDLFDGQDGADVAAMLGENYMAEMMLPLAQVGAVIAVHAQALGVIAERKRWEKTSTRVRDLECAARAALRGLRAHDDLCLDGGMSGHLDDAVDALVAVLGED